MRIDAAPSLVCTFSLRAPSNTAALMFVPEKKEMFHFHPIEKCFIHPSIVIKPLSLQGHVGVGMGDYLAPSVMG